MSAVQIQGVFSHPATEITGSYPRRKCKRGPRCAALPLCSPSSGPFLEALGKFWIFFPVRRQQAADKSLLSAPLPSQGGLRVFFI